MTRPATFKLSIASICCLDDGLMPQAQGMVLELLWTLINGSSLAAQSKLCRTSDTCTGTMDKLTLRGRGVDLWAIEASVRLQLSCIVEHICRLYENTMGCAY